MKVRHLINLLKEETLIKLINNNGFFKMQAFSNDEDYYTDKLHCVLYLDYEIKKVDFEDIWLIIEV